MKIDTLHNETELLTLSASGCEKSFAALFHCYRDKIYSVALRLTGSVFLAEEVVQDIFLKLWVKKENLSGIHEFEDYLFIMTRNHVFSALKRMARQQQLVDDLQLEMPSAENTTYNSILNQEMEQILQQAVELLPAQQKQIYLLSKEEELKRDEIAKMLRISSETVKTHLARALRHIRAYSKLRLDNPISWLLFFLIN
ncbi:ECF RNA polymerase sigma factor SigW [Dyadobacter sp. CECT 9275]|uniref:ECF RNA polymerase sigma factor SigW n=1 Tax=Dyadobacter helix TaxID=2822344 RepID=A0A916JDB9_9BACT|nr:RNA polymerase sigma-70 factor [Dyadobacter sp. CECT 9275]CAG5003191.1 ECF RNA polymerase sigma factor SigW [Dyadobacter sp. CECT 9275]